MYKTIGLVTSVGLLSLIATLTIATQSPQLTYGSWMPDGGYQEIPGLNDESNPNEIAPGAQLKEEPTKDSGAKELAPGDEALDEGLIGGPKKLP